MYANLGSTLGTLASWPQERRLVCTGQTTPLHGVFLPGRNQPPPKFFGWDTERPGLASFLHGGQQEGQTGAVACGAKPNLRQRLSQCWRFGPCADRF